MAYFVLNNKATMFGIPSSVCACVRARTRVGIGRGARGPGDVFVMGCRLSRWRGGSQPATLSAAAPPWERALAVTLMACARHLARFACWPKCVRGESLRFRQRVVANAESKSVSFSQTGF